MFTKVVLDLYKLSANQDVVNAKVKVFLPVCAVWLPSTPGVNVAGGDTSVNNPPRFVRARWLFWALVGAHFDDQRQGRQPIGHGLKRLGLRR